VGSGFEDTQPIHTPLGIAAEIDALLSRLQRLTSDHADPRCRLLAALIQVWHEEPIDELRFHAARALLTLDQRDVWFLSTNDPVEQLDRAASRLLVALSDAITAAGANFYFGHAEPFGPSRDADRAYDELGQALQSWKAEVLQEHRRRRQPT
jgi:hypothetical protein